MSNTVISVENLTKRYELGVIGTGTLSRDLNRWWARLRGQPDPYSTIGQRDHFERIGESILALDDVSFKVEQGEALGIIGKNGAGKSTLLKILSRVTAPTSGVVKVKGRIGSLLEVGTGFHPELTGRENVYLNGAILGMRKDEVDCKFDEIVDFSGVEKFIDTPVKRYSSGMYVRLAFAVAAHLDPEILVVDEVLAVGDAEFQKKCLGKMGDVAGEGRTVLFVSHNMAAIRSLTNRCIYLKNGSVCLLGTTTKVVHHYMSEMKGADNLQRPDLSEYHREFNSEQPVKFERIWLNDSINDISTIPIGGRINIKIEIFNETEIKSANITIVIKRDDGIEVTRILSSDKGISLNIHPGRYIISCEIMDLPITPGDYLVNVGISQSAASRAWDLIRDYPLFKVDDSEGKVIYAPQRDYGVLQWDKVDWII